jgi:hypothetical protein
VREQEKKSLSVPKFTSEQYEYLAKVHPKLDVHPSNTDRQLMYSGGEQSVLATVQKNIGFAPSRLRHDR